MFVPSQLLNMALALACLTPDGAAPTGAWLPLLASILLMGSLAVVAPAAAARGRERAMRAEYLAEQQRSESAH